MKRIIAAIATLALVISLAPRVLAEETTLKGEAVCAKCELHETESCQTAIRVKHDGKTVVYYAENNDVAKKFHGNVCQGSAKVTAVGTVKEKDGKKFVKLTKIEKE